MESDEDEVYGSEDENAGDYMVSSKKFDFLQFDINVTLDVIETPIKNSDPIFSFCAALRSLSQKSP